MGEGGASVGTVWLASAGPSDGDLGWAEREITGKEEAERGIDDGERCRPAPRWSRRFSSTPSKLSWGGAVLELACALAA